MAAASAWVFVNALKPLRDAQSHRFPRTQVSAAKAAGGWLSPEEAAAALTSPPSQQETASSPPPSSPPEPLPPSAVDVVLALMRCNPCEVLGSLSPGIGSDGRIALIGQVNDSGSFGTTRGGKGNDDDGGHDTGGSFRQERHHRDGGETVIRREDRLDGGSKGFRCSVEVAWDKEEGGVFVRRFGMEPDERRPRWECTPLNPALWDELKTCFAKHVFPERAVQELPPMFFRCERSPPGEHQHA